MAQLVGLKDFETKSSRDYRDALLNIQRHMENVLGDDQLLAYICAAGKTIYINVFLRAFKSFKGVDRTMAEMLWALYTLHWRERYGHLKPGAYLDKLEWVTPPTDAEIDAAWKHESASSDEAKRYFGIA